MAIGYEEPAARKSRSGWRRWVGGLSTTNASVAASNALLDRGYGKPVAPIEMDHQAEGPVHRYIPRPGPERRTLCYLGTLGCASLRKGNALERAASRCRNGVAPFSARAASVLIPPKSMPQEFAFYIHFVRSKFYEWRNNSGCDHAIVTHQTARHLDAFNCITPVAGSHRKHRNASNGNRFLSAAPTSPAAMRRPPGEKRKLNKIEMYQCEQ